jgi:hypothetical protein
MRENIVSISNKNKIDLLSLNKFFIEKEDDFLNNLLQRKKHIQPTKENAFKFYLSTLDRDFLSYIKFYDENKEKFYYNYYPNFFKLGYRGRIDFDGVPDELINRELIKELIVYNKYVHSPSYNNNNNILTYIRYTKAEKYLDKELVFLAGKTFTFDEGDSFCDYVPEEYITKELYLEILKNQPVNAYESIYDEMSSDILNDYNILSYILKYQPWAIFNYRDKNNEEFYLLLKEAVLLSKEILESPDIPLNFRQRLEKELNLKEYIFKEVRKLLKEQILKNKNYLIKNIK